MELLQVHTFPDGFFEPVIVTLFTNVVFVKPLFGRHTFRSLQTLIDDVFPSLFANFMGTLVHRFLPPIKTTKTIKSF